MMSLSSLHDCAFRGRLGAVQSLLCEKGVDVDETDSRRLRRTPLHCCLVGAGVVEHPWFSALEGKSSWEKTEEEPLEQQGPAGPASRPQHHAIMRALVENGGCAVNQTDNYGQGHTALDYAASMGRDDLCRYLVAHGAHVVVAQSEEDRLDTTARGGRGREMRGCYPLTPLHSAILGMYHSKYGRFHGLDGRGQPYAMVDSWNVRAEHAEGYRGTVQHLLESGAEVDAKHGDVNFPLLPLQLSLPLRDSTLTRLLLTHGANVNAQGGDHHRGAPLTCLHVAVALGDHAVVQALLDHGADVNANGVVAGSWATADPRCPHLVVSPETHTSYGPLAFALQLRDMELCSLLLQRGANANVAALRWDDNDLGRRGGGASDGRRAPLLHHIVGGVALGIGEKLRFAKELLARGAKTNLADDFGDTALHLAGAAAARDPLMLEYPQSCVVGGGSGGTPSPSTPTMSDRSQRGAAREQGGRAALYNDYVDLCWLLVEAGADMQAKNNDGQLPLSVEYYGGETEHTGVQIQLLHAIMRRAVHRCQRQAQRDAIEKKKHLKPRKQASSTAQQIAKGAVGKQQAAGDTQTATTRTSPNRRRSSVPRAAQMVHVAVSGARLDRRKSSTC